MSEAVSDAARPRRVVQVADYGGPYPGSFVPMLGAAAAAAAEGGYSTTFCFSEVARGRQWLNELTGLGDVVFVKRGSFIGEVRQLQRIVGDAHATPTVVHTHFGFHRPAAILRIRRQQLAVLWHSHSGRTHPIRLRNIANGAVFGRIVNGVICVSSDVQEETLAQRFPARKVQMLSNAIDLGRFELITETERREARRALGLAEVDSVVLHFGWDWARKGGDRLLATAAAMDGRRRLTFLTVVDERRRDVPTQELERRPHVRTLAPRSDVNELYAAADAFLNCSRAEGEPYSVLEALARGLPAVVTDPPIRREIVDDLPGGRAVAPHTEAISGALSEVLALTPAQRADHAVAGRARVASAHSLQSWARHLVAIYDEALGV